MNLWIQRHNFEAIEKDNVSLEEAITTFQTHDWNKELNEFDASQDEKCDPGLGLVPQDGILHICPNKQNKNKVFYHYRIKKRLLGFIPVSSDETHEIPLVSNNKATKLIEYHFSNEQQKILLEK